ncbi:hypothetical protein HK102_000024 [Quaeritorhiza haematococci]|nr:hypothetical protein HK102_000024 [Quaeritorhiza haematococci]
MLDLDLETALGRLVYAALFLSLRQPKDYEVNRQIGLLESVGVVNQETLGFDDKAQVTFRLRSKEGSPDYRYMPEPDLPMIRLTKDYIKRVIKTLPEPMDQRRLRLLDSGLSSQTIVILMDEPGAVEYLDKVMPNRDPRKAANWVVGELFGWLRMRNLKLLQCPVPPESLGLLIDLVEAAEISGW